MQLALVKAKFIVELVHSPADLLLKLKVDDTPIAIPYIAILFNIQVKIGFFLFFTHVNLI